MVEAMQTAAAGAGARLGADRASRLLRTLLAVGVIEIVAGIVVALAPRFGGPLVAAWLAGIIVNLVTMGEFSDVALRDVGLLVAAVALTLLAWDHHKDSA
ncbi:hypothetical protein [Acrocarpospora catenulata]|uniref:hypothetical protein n=1 Tax=Acrocarpospora catenulata TaxID=2836182 RepID=UPI001BDA7BD5|nr:hypothetical protein [Acrocarpospora catenulata]